MTDLVEKFFKEGLTEPEEQALSEALWASEETAEAFARMAQEAYSRYGFPEPTPTKTPRPPAGPQGGLGPWLGAFVVMAGLVTAYFYGRSNWANIKIKGMFSKIVEPKLGSASSSKSAIQVASTWEGRVKKGSLESHPSMREASPLNSKASQRPQTEQANSPAVSAHRVPERSELKMAQTHTPSTSLASPANPASTPINLDQNPSSDYSSLSVIVHLAKEGPLVVRVSDTRGVEIASLYNGKLGPGHWVFEWNGQLANGQHAGPGFYLIEVQSGLFVERKTVQIH